MAASLAVSLIGREGERSGNWNCDKIVRNEQREATTTPMEWKTDRKDGTSGNGKEMWDRLGVQNLFGVLLGMRWQNGIGRDGK